MLFQVFINALIVGSVYALVACGFVLTYVVTRFANFGHGATIGIAAYAFLIFFDLVGWLGAFLLSIFFAVGFNYLAYTFLYKRLIRNKASKVILLLISFAVMLAVESLLQIIFTASPRRIDLAVVQGMDFFGAKITWIQILIIVVTLLILITVWIVFRKTKFGNVFKAVSDNQELAEIYGINAEKIMLYSFLIAGVLGAIAGTIITLEYVLTPTLGTFYMIKGFIGAVTGGISSVYGAIFGSYLVGLFENYGAWFFLSTYKDAIAFIMLFLVLLIRPQGLFGIKKGIRE
jgi:branched-subunit amino acid ABC-type transport system permease component